MAALMVIQWATGTVGQHAMKAVLDLPHLELVGALAYDPAKPGRDAGELCGAGPVGVAVTTDREAVFAMPADCVLYMAQGEGKREQVLDDVCRQQQVNDKCFASFDEVPIYAVTVTIPYIMKSKHLICTVPGANKADAVNRAITGDITTECPASILRRHPSSVMYLDADAAAKLP